MGSKDLQKSVSTFFKRYERKLMKSFNLFLPVWKPSHWNELAWKYNQIENHGGQHPIAKIIWKVIYCDKLYLLLNLRVRIY